MGILMCLRKKVWIKLNFYLKEAICAKRLRDKKLLKRIEDSFYLLETSYDYI